MDMKRTALFFASTAILFSSPYAMAEQPALNRPYISSNTNVPQMLLAQVEEQEPEAEAVEEPIRKKRSVEKQVDDAKQRAAEESDAAAESQKQAAEQAKEQADQAAKDAEAEAAAKAERAQRDAQAESDKAAEKQKAIESEAKQKAADEAKAVESAQKKAAKDAEQAKREAQAEADKAAEEQKAVGEAARAKAAEESEAAKAAEKETAKEAEKAKKAAQQETDKAAEAQKQAEEDARKKADRAQKAAEKQSEQAAEDAKKAADEATKKTPVQQTSPDAEKPPVETTDQPAGETPTVPSQEAKPLAPDPNAKPTDETTEAPSGQTAKPEQQEASPLPENAAPVLDSEKPLKGGRKEKGGKQDQITGETQQEQPASPAPETAPVAPPKTDADVQQELAPVKVEPVRTEKGVRTKEPRRDERPDDVQVIKQFDNRTIVEVNNNIFVESSDRPRMSRDAQDVYYEDLPRNRTRETIVRENGVQIITVRNRYGDVIQRSRLMPDGREVVLSYTPDYDREERLVWRDPGDDLPPLRLTIPVREYIMDAEEVPEEDVYEFFAQPPVERVERLYSIDEVKRSARIRDKVRRVDLDTITFPFGSAEIGEDQITRIESVAKAMAQILKKNPAETFLIEGHTDAVGSDQANLVLSDKRAESVAQALTNVFDIPPENMATQGYGENYLKIKSEGPEQQNRRVAIRRITPLVAPMASNN